MNEPQHASHKVVIGLQPFGTILMNRTLTYCHATDQPRDQETVRNIFYQAVVQSFSKLHPRTQDFMYDIMEIPYWETMNYTDASVRETAFQTYAAEVRAFALSLRHHMEQRGFLKEGRHYYVESATELLAVVAFYDDSAYV